MEQCVEFDNDVGESIIQGETKRAKPIAYLAQQNETFEGCSI